MVFRECRGREEINRFVESTEYGHVHQLYEWGKAKASSGWKALRYVVEDQGRIIASVSLLQKKRFGFSILYGSRGPVVNFDDLDALRFVLDHLKKVARENRAIFLRISPAVKSDRTDVIDELLRFDYMRAANPLQHIQTTTLDLTMDEEILLASFHHKTRYNIRLSQKKGLEVRVCQDTKEVDLFYELLRQAAERRGYRLQPAQFFRDVFNFVVKRGHGALYLAYLDGKMIAGVYNLFAARKSWYMWGVFDPGFPKLYVSYLLHWYAIRDAKQRGLRIYDLQGLPQVENESSPMYGIYQFKKGFNGREMQWIGEFDYSPPLLRPAYTLLTSIRRNVTKR